MIGKRPEAEDCSGGYPLFPAQTKPPTPAAPPATCPAPPSPHLQPHPRGSPYSGQRPGRTVLDEEDAPVPADAVGPPARQVQPVDVIRHGDNGGGGGRGGGAQAQSVPAPPGGTGTRLGKCRTTPGPPRSKHLLSSDLPPRLCLRRITKEGGKGKKHLPTKAMQLTPWEPGCHPACEPGFRGHPPSAAARLSK